MNRLGRALADPTRCRILLDRPAYPAQLAATLGLTRPNLSQTAALGPADRAHLGRRAQLLAGASVSYNVVEAVVAITAGFVIGSVALIGWSWADPLAALVIAAVAVREGREAWRGDTCACGPTSEPR